MRIIALAVGRIKDSGLRALLDDYAKRIQRYARFEEIELKDETEIVARFERAIPERSLVIALEVDGVSWTSQSLSQRIAQCENNGTPALVFLIGGAYGLPKETSTRADIRLSLSAMTLPHRLARVVLFEQIYRAYTILRNEPYSH